MKPQWQRQQEQMRKQMDQARRQQMGAAWLEQQKAKEEHLAPPLPPSEIPAQVVEIEQEASRLQKALANGTLSKAQVKSRMKDLQYQDQAGTIWTIGYQTGDWYRLAGEEWVRARPPWKAMPATPSQQGPKKKTAHPVAAAGALFAGLLLTLLFGWVVGYSSYEYLGFENPNDLIVAGIAWGLGVLWSIRWALKVWKGNS